MEFTEFTAEKNDSQKRLDKICLTLLASCTRGEVFSAIRKGLIKLNKKKAQPGDTVSEGDKIQIASFLNPVKPKTCSTESKKDFPFKIIFKNEHILVIDKPSGISVQPSLGQELSVSQIVLDCFTGDTSLSFTPAPLHRLDRYTSGLLVISQSAEGARIFKEMMQNHQIKKTYLGVAEGCQNLNEEWNDWLLPEQKSQGFYTVSVSAKKTDGAKKAVTYAKTLACSKNLSLIQYSIQTGRKHQIRGQSAFHGYPLAGDSAYGAAPLNVTNKFFLHAYSLDFPKDNALNIPLHITAPLPEYFKEFLKNNLLNWDGKTIL